jgi:hypothetical protein
VSHTKGNRRRIAATAVIAIAVIAASCSSSKSSSVAGATTTSASGKSQEKGGGKSGGVGIAASVAYNTLHSTTAATVLSGADLDGAGAVSILSGSLIDAGATAVGSAVAVGQSSGQKVSIGAAVSLNFMPQPGLSGCGGATQRQPFTARGRWAPLETAPFALIPIYIATEKYVCPFWARGLAKEARLGRARRRCCKFTRPSSLSS